MIFIIIMAAIVIGCSIKGIIDGINYGSVAICFLMTVLGAVASVGGLIFSALIQPAIPTTYEEPEIVAEQEIVSLSNELGIDGHGGLFYVSVNSENIYSYRVALENERITGETAYEVRTIGEDEKVLEVETTDGSKPRLVKYNENGKMSFWSMGFDKVTYVFYVPEGTISKEISLS